MADNLKYRVELEHVSVSYQKDLILSKISMSLQESHIYGLVSKNGVGKTTLLKVIAGILAVSNGTVKYNNNTQVGYSIEDSLLINGLTVEQNIVYYAKLCGKYDKSAIEEIIELTGVQDYRKKYVKRLSKGMRQRTSIGISLVGQPNLLLWDEAISGVDILSKKEISDKVLTMAKEYRTCIVAADHNVLNLLPICDDYIFFKEDGSIVISAKKALFDDNDIDRGQNQIEQKFIDILENGRYETD